MIDSLIGNRYRIKALIGEGGMASVYAALDEKLERRVAIKILHPHLARNPDIRERFLLEAKTVSGLDHPNIIRVYDFSGLDSGQLWMVTEILYGEDLSDFVKSFNQSRLQFIIATLITREICRALHEAHKLKIVHRDIKPENIMMLTNGQLKLMDFGIAKVHRANATQTGIFMGSPSYMSPEQIRGVDVDSRADIYSLCVLFYEIITGTLPFVGKSTAEVINRIMVGRYTPPNMVITDLPYALNLIIVKGLQPQKEDRYQSVAEMGTVLDNFLNNCNMRESRIELEEFCKNRAKFEERLAQILAGRSKTPPAKGNEPNQAGPGRSPLSGKANAQQSPLSPLSPAGNGIPMPVPTMILDESQMPTLPPVRGSQPTITAPGTRDQRPQAGRSGNSKEPQSNRGPSVDAKGRSTAPPSNPRQTISSQSPIRPTQPPRQTSSQSRKSKKAAYRVFAHDERRSSSGNLGILLALSAVVAVVLTFMFGGERLSNRFKHDPSTRVTNGETNPRQTRKPRVDSKEIDPTGTGRVAAVVNNPKPGDEIVTSPLESQTIVIKSDGKSKPKIPSTPVVTSTKTPLIKPTEKAEPSPVVIKPESTPASLTTEKAPEDKMPETKPAEKINPGEQGTLRLTALPAAEVFLDGKMQGTTNEKKFVSQGVKLDPGSYLLRLRRRGYKVDEQMIQIKPGELRQINVTLSKLTELVELSVQTNKIPATVVIEENKSGGRKREMAMTKHSIQINLKPGSYKVNVSYEDESINRVIELSEENKSINFNADFK